MSQAKVKFPDWARKLRWLWFAIGAWGLLQTPFAVRDVMNLVRSDHNLMFVLFIALPMRLLLIGVFFWLWWGTRTRKAEQEARSESHD